MHKYRTHNCNQLRSKHVGNKVKLSGWINKKRDHGNLLFIDLRDHYGICQCVIEINSPLFEKLEHLKLESVITITGEVVKRLGDNINKNLSTGDIEVTIEDIVIESGAKTLPFPVSHEVNYSEELRLKYRFLDLRKETLHNNIVLRSQIINYLRNAMIEQDFLEVQTPILTASSPEGARDFLVASRLHPGKFYALPQAPQQFKQLLMCSGFDKYFQIAPCFRDEDARADRSPGEFYQLDFEMAYVTQEDVFQTIEPVLYETYKKFAPQGYKVSPTPFRRIPYKEAMLKYGSDKPDLRNPLIIKDATTIFKDSSFSLFAKLINNGAKVRAIPAPKGNTKPRSFFDKLNNWARKEGYGGLGYIIFDNQGEAKGPIAKNLDDERLLQIKKLCELENNDAVFFACDKENKVASFAGQTRTKICTELDLLKKNAFELCWVVDFPMYELDEETNKIQFSHNPFSMPQGELNALETEDPLDILAWQYDIVCNGIELSSGAIRNHQPEIMYKAFEIAGYPADIVDKQFGGMINAFKYGAPPHGGCAPGIDRMIMQLTDQPNIREIIAFPLNQKAEDLMMKAPSNINQSQLNELHIQLKLPKETNK